MLSRHVLLLVFFMGVQGAFWWHVHTIRPADDTVPPPPGEAVLQALSFGDAEFLFRLQALGVQNFGDGFGRSVALRYYDYAYLYQWMTLLDGLNHRSHLLPSLAAYYFSETQNALDAHYMFYYLYAHSVHEPEKNWWWLLQAVYLGMHRLGDMDLALKAAKPMVSAGVPVWAQQMAAVVYEKRGEMADALRIMETIRDNAVQLSDQDLRYMRYFIEERLHKLENAH